MLIHLQSLSKPLLILSIATAISEELGSANENTDSNNESQPNPDGSSDQAPTSDARCESPNVSVWFIYSLLIFLPFFVLVKQNRKLAASFVEQTQDLKILDRSDHFATTRVSFPPWDETDNRDKCNIYGFYYMGM